jgi:glycosyltransferase involved in cell wall biosynthesis
MRILIAVHGFPPTHSAGAERQAERMAFWLLQHHYDVEVFAIETLNSQDCHVETSTNHGLTVHRLHYDLGKGNDPFVNLYDNADVANALEGLLKERQYDLVHFISGYLLGARTIQTVRRLGIPVVISPMEYWFLCAQLNLLQPTGVLCSGPESDQKCARCLMENKRRYRLPAKVVPPLADAFWKVGMHLPEPKQMAAAVKQRRLRLQEVMNEVDVVICNSRFLIGKFEEFGFKNEKFVYLRQGLPGAKTHVVKEQCDTKELRIGYIGQMKYHKGVDVVVDAVLKLLNEGQPVSLDLWGGDDGAEAHFSSELKARTQHYPAIRWNGTYTGSKVWDILSTLDVLVVPSRWYENSPNVILEAHHAKLPVIVTDLGGMAELVEHEVNGLRFKLNDVDDLRNQLQRLISEPNLLHRLRSGIQPVRTIDQEMQDIVYHYQQVVSKSLA